MAFFICNTRYLRLLFGFYIKKLRWCSSPKHSCQEFNWAIQLQEKNPSFGRWPRWEQRLSASLPSSFITSGRIMMRCMPRAIYLLPRQKYILESCFRATQQSTCMKREPFGQILGPRLSLIQSSLVPYENKITSYSRVFFLKSSLGGTLQANYISRVYYTKSCLMDNCSSCER